MPLDTTRVKSQPSSRHATVLSGALSVLVSLLILVGWTIGSQVLIGGSPASVAVNPMAAISGILLGCALLLDHGRGSVRAQRIGLAAATLGFLIPLIQVILLLARSSFAFDRLLFPGQIPALEIDGPGRFISGHAILLLLLGGALLLVRRKTEPARLTARAISIMMAGLFGLAILAMLTRAASGTPNPSTNKPAVALTVLLSLLSVGAVAASADTGLEPEAETIRILRRRIRVALGVAFGILTIATGISLWSVYRSQEAARQRGSARATMLAVAGVVDGLQEAEAAERGYLLTRNDGDRDRFANARDSLPIRIKMLDSLIASSPTAPVGLERLKNGIQARLVLIDETFSLEDGGQHTAAVTQVESEADRRLAIELRDQAARIAQQSDSIARHWDDRLRSGGNVSLVVNLMAGLFALIFLGLAGVAFNRDLGRRAEVERELAASEQRLSQVVTLLPNVVVLKEPKELRYVLVNWAGTNSLGFTSEELLGKTSFDVVPEEEARRITAEDRQALASPGVVDLPDQVVHSPRLGRRIIHSKKVAIRDERGEPVYLLTVTEDITDRKQAEEAVRAAKDAAEAANRAKSGFLAKMSHELRTPLNSIIGFSEILEDGGAGPINDKQRRYVGNVLLSGRNLLQLINDILDLSKVEAGRVELSRATFPVVPLLEEVRTVVQTMAEKKGLSVRVSADQDTASLTADRVRIAQVLTNLAANAVKFTPEGGSVELGASRGTDPQGERDEIQFWVRDTGVGIAPEDQERVFREFEQVGSGGPGEREGTGLGLALAKRLVELHDGWISVESALGKGSTFRFCLPAAAGDTDPITRGRPTPETPPPGDSPLVLVIDDEPNARDLLTHYLESAGYRVMSTVGGERAVALAKRFRPDAITLDIMMPEQDGFEILAHLKSAEATRTIPVVVVSVVDSRELGLTLGAEEWLVKPVQRTALLGALERIVGAAPSREKRRITIIDDDPATLEQLSLLLVQQGFKVDQASSGAEGIELARRSRPDLIVLDLVMPGMNGFDVVHRLKSDHQLATIPILILTAKDLTTQERDILRNSVQAVVTKGGRAALLSELRRLVVGAPA